MKDDVINRQAAIKDAQTWVAVDDHERHLKKDVIEWLKEFPPAQCKTGKWIDDGDPLTLVCSECGYRVARYNNTPYCPYCGAKMEENEDEITLTFNPPITEEQWDIIEDVDFDYTDSITFYTKHGKEVEFVKRKTGEWIPVTERLPEKTGTYLCSIKCTKGEWVEVDYWDGDDWYDGDIHGERATDFVTHWIPLPEPYKEG